MCTFLSIFIHVCTNYPPLKEYIIEILTKFCKQSLSRLLFQSIIKLSRNVNSRKTVSKRKRTKSRYSIAYIHRACITDTFPPFERYTQRSEHVERGEGTINASPPPFSAWQKTFRCYWKKKKNRTKNDTSNDSTIRGYLPSFFPALEFFSHSFISIVTLPVRLDSLFRLSNNRNPSFTIQNPIEYRSSRLPTSPAPPEISYIMRQWDRKKDGGGPNGTISSVDPVQGDRTNCYSILIL